MSTVPHHIAIVMDGNGRWATRRMLPRVAGHKRGVDVLRRCVRACAERGVGVLTVFAFSSENWSRPADEVSALLDLLAAALAREVPQLCKDGVRVHFVGNRQALSDKVRAGLEQAEAATAHNTRLVLNVCFNYGGRWDVAQAAAESLDPRIDDRRLGGRARSRVGHPPRRRHARPQRERPRRHAAAVEDVLCRRPAGAGGRGGTHRCSASRSPATSSTVVKEVSV